MHLGHAMRVAVARGGISLAAHLHKEDIHLHSSSQLSNKIRLKFT
jgi:hypothetical protein